MNEGVTITPFVTAELEGANSFIISCPRGHTTRIKLLQAHFKILFESGIFALIDGYLREAVSTIAASLERFYEYWIRVSLLQRDLDPRILDITWKNVSVSSERQFGAYVFTYLLLNGQAPAVLTNQQREFRNNVIHKGQFPTRSEVEQFASAVMALITPEYKKLIDTGRRGMDLLEVDEQKKIDRKEYFAIAKITTTLGRAVEIFPESVSLADELLLADDRRKGTGSWQNHREGDESSSKSHS
jgi:hypothetical protein